MKDLQFLTGEDGQRTHAVIPMRLWRAWRLDEAFLSDEALLAKAAQEDDGTPPVPSWVVKDLSAGDHPIKVYCKLRGITQKELSEKTGIDAGYISNMIKRNRPISDVSRTKLAKVLQIDPEDIDPWPQH